MNFTNGALAGLMAATPGDPQVAAEQANLCMEERVSTARQATYEARMDAPQTWNDWRGNHDRYVQEEVRRRYPLSAAFTDGELSLRPGIEPNQYLCRVEQIDGLLKEYGPAMGRLERNSLSAGDVARLREAHLDCIRRSPGNAEYGRNC